MSKLDFFNEFRMGKGQMNHITGGAVQCTVDGEHIGFFLSDDPEATEESLKKLYGDGVKCELSNP